MITIGDLEATVVLASECVAGGKWKSLHLHFKAGRTNYIIEAKDMDRVYSEHLYVAINTYNDL